VTRFDDGCETVIHFPGSAGPPVSLRSTVEAFEQTLLELDPAVLRPILTGFSHLDVNTGGGLHAEDLVLVVGRQNVRKTLFVSQLGRNIARWAARVRNKVVCVLICYEHSSILLLERLLCVELWLAGGSEGGVCLAEIRDMLADLADKGALEDVSSLLLKLPKTTLLGWRVMERYLETLYLYRGDPVYTSPEAIDNMVVVLQRQGLHPVVIVDYAQRVPSPPELAGLGREHYIDYYRKSTSRKETSACRRVAAAALVEIRGLKPILGGLRGRFKLAGQLLRSATGSNELGNLLPVLQRVRCPRSRHRELLSQSIEVSRLPVQHLWTKYRDGPRSLPSALQRLSYPAWSPAWLRWRSRHGGSLNRLRPRAG